VQDLIAHGDLDPEILTRQIIRQRGLGVLAKSLAQPISKSWPATWTPRGKKHWPGVYWPDSTMLRCDVCWKDVPVVVPE